NAARTLPARSPSPPTWDCGPCAEAGSSGRSCRTPGSRCAGPAPGSSPSRPGSSSPRAPRPSPPAGDNAWPASRSTRIWSWCSLIALLLSIRHVEFGLEQRSEVRGAGARLLLAGELLHGLGILRHVPGLDRKIDRAVLAVDVDDHRRY